MIGDVTGHDMGAAALMGQLRSMLRGLTWTFQEPPGAILRRLDDANLGIGLRATASALLAHLDPPGAGRRARAALVQRRAPAARAAPARRVRDAELRGHARTCSWGSGPGWPGRTTR